MRLASIPGPTNSNPFSIALYRELSVYGVEVVGEGRLHPRWLWQNRSDIDVLHLHWPETEFLKSNPLRTAMRILRFGGQLLMARALGYRIIWTAHNIELHQEYQKLFGHVGLLLMAWLAHDIFVNYRAEVGEVEKRFGRRHRVHVAYHGNYIGWYPDGLSRAEARRRLGLGEGDFVYLMLGRMHKYKGVAEAVAAFGRLANPEERLLLAGLFKDADLLAEAEAAARSDPRILIHNAVVADEDLQVFFRAADVALLPFRFVSTSGSLLLALSFGLPVIASDIGNVQELVTPLTGLKCEAGSVESLADCMARMRSVDLKALSQGARACAEAYTWMDAAGSMAAALGVAGPVAARAKLCL